MVNQDKIKEAVKLLLEGIGEDVTREGLVDTPERIARMYAEIMSGMDENPIEHLSKVFTVDNNEMVLEKDIVFYYVRASYVTFLRESTCGIHTKRQGSRAQ